MRRILGAATTVALIAVVSAAFPQSASAVYQGDAVTTAPPWSAYITFDKKYFLGLKTSESTCSGEVVADGWVLTAAHCVVTEDSNGNPTNTVQDLRTFLVVLGRNNIQQPRSSGRQYTVDEVDVFPGWPLGTGDLALMKLHGALPSSALSLPLAPEGSLLPAGTPLTAYGYGNVSESYKKQDLASGQIDKYSGVPTDYLRRTRSGSYTVDTAVCGQYFLCLHRTGQSMILHGDSGGPWVDSDQNVVAVTHALADYVKTSATTIEWNYATATPTTSPVAHSWIVDTAGVVQPSVGAVVRNPDTGASWLFEDDGLAHRIANGDTYDCLIGQGHPVRNLSAFQLSEIPRASHDAACASGPSVVVALNSPAAGANPCAVYNDGSAKCWGWNNWGQLGDGTTTERTTATPVAGLADVSAISNVNSDHACALQTNGTVECWGHNDHGQLGDGTTTDRLTPTPVPGLTNVTEISAGGDQTCALLTDTTVQCWGSDTYGQLGDGNSTDRPTPAPVPGLSGVSTIGTGAQHACALLQTGVVECWGYNAESQVGDGTTTDQPTPSPVPMPGAAPVTSLVVGPYDNCAVLADATAACWGWNSFGQLGDGTFTDRPTPTSVVGLSGVISISAAYLHTCAQLVRGTVDCWGDNTYGELGTGSTAPVQQPLPTQVTVTSGIMQIQAGSDFATCALLADHTVQCWGYNAQGQLGDGTTTNHLTAAPVVGL